MYTDGKYALTAGRSGVVHVWDVARGQAIGEMHAPLAMPLSELSASPDRRCVVAGAEDGSVLVWSSQRV